MALKILSQQLTADAEQDLAFPVGAMTLHARENLGKIVIWYRGDDGAPTNTRKFSLRHTDEACPAPDIADYIGTVLLDGGYTEWHIFERFEGRV